MDNRFVKISDREFEILKPKRGKYSRSIAYIDLKRLLFACNRETVLRIDQSLEKLGRWENAIALDFLNQRWRWKDSGRVSKQLKAWQKEGLISIRKTKRSNRNIIRLSVDKPIDKSIDKSVPRSVGYAIDNQMVVRAIEIPPSVDKLIGRSIDEQLIKEDKKLKKNTTTSSEKKKNEEFKFAYEEQIEMLLSFFKTEVGANTLKIRCDELKINVPSTNLLVKEVTKWAQNKYLNQSAILASYKNGTKCWIDFSRYWLKYVRKDWAQIGEEPKKVISRRNRKSKKTEKRIFVETDYDESKAHNNVLLERMNKKIS